MPQNKPREFTLKERWDAGIEVLSNASKRRQSELGAMPKGAVQGAANVLGKPAKRKRLIKYGEPK